MSSTRTPPPAANPEANAAPGGYLRLTNGTTSILLAFGAPDATLPGFARLIGPTLLVAPATTALPTLSGYVRPWALVAIASGVGTDTAGLPARTLTVPQGHGFTMLLEASAIRIQNIPELPAWAARG